MAWCTIFIYHCRNFTYFVYRRGISRGGGLDYTQGHTADDKLPQGFVDTLNDALYNYDSGSDRSSPTTAQYLEASNNNWTNLTTDRSSSYDSTVTEYDVG